MDSYRKDTGGMDAPPTYAPTSFQPQASAYVDVGSRTAGRPEGRVVSYPKYVYLSWAVAICCCPIFGVLGYHHAKFAERDAADGFPDASEKHRKYSKYFMIGGLVTGLVVSIIYFIVKVSIRDSMEILYEDCRERLKSIQRGDISLSNN